ncbi:MAG: ribosome assembly RNA-binding protein YhbY [Gammaproteobacteria bacterium]|nr:MAG: ribosome assembly RNA-binding protein YhbY [Gammaproteobacteria bacterium]
MSLTKNQIKHLRSLAHNLKPVILVGQNGVTENLMNELNIALDHHELLKVKLASDDREHRQAMVEDIVTQSHADKVQIIGKTLVLFRRNTKKPVIELPKH